MDNKTDSLQCTIGIRRQKADRRMSVIDRTAVILSVIIPSSRSDWTQRGKMPSKETTTFGLKRPASVDIHYSFPRYQYSWIRGWRGSSHNLWSLFGSNMGPNLRNIGKVQIINYFLRFPWSESQTLHFGTTLSEFWGFPCLCMTPVLTSSPHANSPSR